MEETYQFDHVLKQLEREYRRIPNAIATLAVNFSKERFRAQNWIDDRTEPWKPRKTSNWGLKRNKQRRSRTRPRQRGILIQSGRLRRSIRKISANENEVVIGTDVEYAEMHNEGFRGTIEQNVKQHTRTVTKPGRRRNSRRVAVAQITVKAHKRTTRVNMPRRRFLGESAALSRQIERYTEAALIRALRSS